MKATMFPQPDGRQRVTVGGIIVGYIAPSPVGWEARSLAGEHLSYEHGIVDAVRAVVGAVYPEVFIDLVEEEEA